MGTLLKAAALSIALATYFVVSVPAFAEEVLYCTDTTDVHVAWDKNGEIITRPGTGPTRFIVRVVSATRRLVGGTSWIAYDCRSVWAPRVACEDGTGSSFVFHDGQRYTRTFVFLPDVSPSSDAPIIAIAHGTCTKF
jgi:hypothetical protein